ncbi:uncharacterized protein BDZ99DRAFT_523786 [Mytilinidion resinicola]|uniref:DUF7587 domain-containing protein n=1 Tax=Mytilinidion resinicola TaxID=574789 RepID=A0A6A6YCN0_9PEZI|nr:uncharacterized protein BDZ99DRAFT_523786 [Mytilinidion resinicola]KAF2806328.1 hypothetical protein BDZ99DRAFT_523786 [Mytilinidion resinicola]
MAKENILDKFTVFDLLNGASPDLSTEERLRPWRHNRSHSFRLPLLRIWDTFSGSQPDEHNKMNSRAPNKRLDNIESRRTSLATHINHEDWMPTPFVSFTSSPAAVNELAEWRKLRRGDQTLTAIDPSIRISNGLPILDLAAEMEHYDISNPYGKKDQYCIDHYVCLWQVTEDEIISHWKWDELAASENWYEDIVMPAFQNFSQSSIPKAEDSDLSKIMDRLSLHDESPDAASYLSEVPGTLSVGHNCFSENEFWVSDNSADEGCYYDGENEDWDTDDEVE